MFRIAICDDEKIICAQIENMFGRFCILRFVKANSCEVLKGKRYFQTLVI